MTQKSFLTVLGVINTILLPISIYTGNSDAFLMNVMGMATIGLGLFIEERYGKKQ